MYRIQKNFTRAGPVAARDVMWFNWPAFLSTGVVAAVALAATRWIGLPRWVRLLLVGVGVAGSYGLLSASAATWWVFDHSGITRWRWLPSVLPADVNDWVNVTTGFDDTSQALATILPSADGRTIDLFDDDLEHDGAILRARDLRPPGPESVRITSLPLPITSSSADAVFLLMAAHEVRDRAARRALLGEVARILRPTGRLVIVEHLRDLPNTVVFGPGAMHFHSASTWIADTQAAGLRLVERRGMTRFVAAFVLERQAA